MKGYSIEACSRAGTDRDKNEDNFFAASQMASSSDEFVSIESPESCHRLLFVLLPTVLVAMRTGKPLVGLS